MSAMATGTQALIARYYAAFNRADWEGMLELLADDVAHDLNQGERQYGRERFGVFLQQMARCYLEVLSEVRVLVSEDGRHAAAEYIVSGQYLQAHAELPSARGQRYRLSGGAFFDVVDGRIARVSNHYNLSDWIAQVSRLD